jgi:hypothetical protein
MSSVNSRNAVSDYSLYNICTVDIASIQPDKLEHLPITNYFWWPIPDVRQKLSKYLDRCGITDNIIDVGCGNIPFEPATHVLDFKDVRDDNRIVFKYDLDFDKFPVSDNYFNFVYSRHTLEDIQNPQNAFNELCRVSPRGYIETPSPLIELSRGVDVFGDYRGYHHHRYIIWSNVSDNTLHFLPKYPLVENISIDRDTEKVYNFIGNNYPLYWNNYYFWDSDNPPKMVLYRHRINMDILQDYVRLLQEAIHKSIEYTNSFISRF